MSRLMIGVLLSLGLFCSFSAAASAHKGQQVVVPFSMAKSGHLIINVSFEGMPPTAMLIDTAAGISLLDRRVAKEMGLSSGRYSKVKLAGLGTSRQSMKNLQIQDIEIGMAVFPAPKFYTTDLKHIRYIRADDAKVSGILGTDFLIKHNGIVNYVDQTLTLNW